MSREITNHKIIIKYQGKTDTYFYPDKESLEENLDEIKEFDTIEIWHFGKLEQTFRARN